MSVVGTVKAVSYKHSSVLVGGKWYNIAEPLLKKIRVGETYQFGISGKTVVSVDRLGQEKPQQQDEKTAYWLKKNKEVRRLALLNTAVEIHKIRTSIDGTAPTEDDIIRTAAYLEKWVIEEEDKNGGN